MTGECYFDQCDVDALKHDGHTFDDTNASTLIHLYEKYSESFLDDLNGWFNGLLIDIRRGRAMIFNDRYGMRRIYYHEGKDAFYFASEAKALLRVLPELRQADLRSIGEYIVFDCVLEGRTYFRDISLLPSGSAWTFEKGRICKRTYHDTASLENLPKIPSETFFEEFASTFADILPRYFKGGPVSMSLTGGLDTRAIMACLTPTPGSIPCFTFGGEYKDIFDVRLAPKVAKECGQTHTVLRSHDVDFLKNYSDHAEASTWITDGVVPVDMADMLQFNKMARGISQIRMTGKYGSQVLKNVTAFKDRSPYPELIAPEFSSCLSTARETARALAGLHSFSFLLSNEIPWWWNGMLSAESSQVEVRSPYLDNDLIKLLYRGPGPQLTAGADLQLDLIRKYKPDLLRIPTTGTHGGTIPIISGIVKNMINAFIIADKLYIRERLPYSLTHTVAKLDKAFISPLCLDRIFFGYTDFRRYRQWFSNELAGYLSDILLSKKTLERPYWNPEYIRKLLNAHIKGRGTYLREIRKVLQIELIHRVLIEKQY